MNKNVLEKFKKSKLIIDLLENIFKKKYKKSNLNKKLVIESLKSSFVALDIPFIISARKKELVFFCFKKFLKYFSKIIYFFFKKINNLFLKNPKINKIVLDEIFICTSKYISRETLYPLYKKENFKKKIFFLKSENILYFNDSNLKIELNYSVSLKKLKDFIITQISLVRVLIKNFYRFREKLNYLQFISLILSILTESFATFEAFYDFKYLKERILLSKNKHLKLFTADVSCPYTRTMVELFNKDKFNSIVLQFGSYGEEAFEWIYCNSKNIFAWGSKYKILFSKFIKNKNINIFITGTPRFDYIYSQNKIQGYTFKKDQKKFSILFLSTYGHRSYDVLFRGFNKNLKKSKIQLLEFFKSKNISLDIKPHPLEKDELKVYKNFRNTNLISPELDVREILVGYDLVITYGSTLTYDSILQGTNIVLYRPHPVAWYPNVFSNKKIFPVINNVNELDSLLEKFTPNKYNIYDSRDLEKHIYKLGESNLDYIIKKISKL